MSKFMQAVKALWMNRVIRFDLIAILVLVVLLAILPSPFFFLTLGIGSFVVGVSKWQRDDSVLMTFWLIIAIAPLSLFVTWGNLAIGLRLITSFNQLFLSFWLVISAQFLVIVGMFIEMLFSVKMANKA